MNKFLLRLALSLVAISSINTKAGMISMPDYIRLKPGMSEADVLYRVGRYDHESVRTDNDGNIVEKHWYYIPTKEGSNQWISEIVINNLGEIKSIDRYKASNTNVGRVSMRDFIRLKPGMSEAEVLYRVGRYDRQSVRTDYNQNVIEKRWYYIPVTEGSNQWITEIVINNFGEIESVDRYRARK